jgi:hypothetical protein
MEKLELQKKLIEKINNIDDLNMLKSIDLLLSTSKENLANFLSFATEQNKNGDVSETEDFTNYIKEWVKSM